MSNYILALLPHHHEIILRDHPHTIITELALIKFFYSNNLSEILLGT